MITDYKKYSPEIGDGAFIAENATVAGKVKIGKKSSVWFGAVVRGDMNSITVGDNSNIQDNAVIHVGLNTPVTIGNGVSIGHGACVHGANVGDNTLIGMNSVVLDGAKIGKDCIVGAGAVVTAGTVIPDGSMALGTPAKIVKKTDLKQVLSNKTNALAYVNLAKYFAK